MKTFATKLRELMEEKNLNIKMLANLLGIKNASAVSVWLKDKHLPNYKYAILIADYFNVSLDYLFLNDVNLKYNFNSTPPFDAQLKSILKEFNTSQYKLIKDGICTNDSFYKWYKIKSLPNIESLIKLADYFNISLDYLVGRE